MSIQDESFPHDELFSEAEFSFSNNAHQRYQFPNGRRHNQQQQQQQHIEQLKENVKFIELKAKVDAENASAVATDDAHKAMNKSSVSGTSSNEENSSIESANGRPSSVLSGKTTVSEPINFEGEKSHLNAHTGDAHNNVLGKANSYQNMHSEYTKRRYRHVQSKVGQYIAQMKAEDEKRRNAVKFQRHRSLPETLVQDQQQLAVADNISSNNNNMKHYHHHPREKRYSSLDLQMPKMDESISDAEVNLSEMLTATATTTTTASSGSSTTSSSSMQRHECSTDDAAQITNIDFIDKLTYAQLVNEKERIQSYSDYLQVRLDAKMSENMRLNRNVEYLRIELSRCQDKLKRQCTQQHNQSSSMSMRANCSNSLSGSSSAMHALGRQMLGGSLSMNNTTRSTKATQTDLQMPSLPTATATPMKLSVLLAHDMFSTPDITPTSDTNNNHTYESDATDCDATGNTNGNMSTAAAGAKGNKSVATIQPISLNMSNIAGGERSSLDNSHQHNNVLRQRLNSGYQQQFHQQSHLLGVSNARDSTRSCCPSSSDSAIDIEPAEMAPSPKRQRSRINMGGAEEVDASEFVYYSGITGRVTLESHNANSPAIMLSNLNFSERSDSSCSVEMPSSSYACRNAIGGNKKQKSLRRRWLRFFSPCSRCKDLNQTIVDNCSPNTSDKSQTQIPLLEKSVE